MELHANHPIQARLVYHPQQRGGTRLASVGSGLILEARQNETTVLHERANFTVRLAADKLDVGENAQDKTSGDSSHLEVRQGTRAKSQQRTEAALRPPENRRTLTTYHHCLRTNHHWPTPLCRAAKTNPQKQMNRLLLFLLAALTASAQTEPPVAPAQDEAFSGASFTVSFNGTAPLSYQWYRVKGEENVKIEAPEGIQRTLVIAPPYVAGVYFCEVSNVAGVVKSKTFRLSVTRQEAAADMQIIIKSP